MAAVADRSSGSSALYRVAYEEAVRALVEQQAIIESMRGRAGLLLTTAAITTSFLAAHALNNVSSPLPWAALICFVGVATLSLAILWPRDWEVAVVPSKLILDRAAGPAGSRHAGDLHRDLAVSMGERHDDGSLDRRHRIDGVALGAMAQSSQDSPAESRPGVRKIEMVGHEPPFSLRLLLRRRKQSPSLEVPPPGVRKIEMVGHEPPFSLKYLLPKRFRRRG